VVIPLQRSDLPAKYYDRILFKDATFANLLTNNTPFIGMNGTDIATGNRIPFTQYMVDVFSSDVEPYPLSMATAASSAVPGLLAPITPNNYSGRFEEPAPAWLTREYPEDAFSARALNERLKVYLNSTNFHYLHLSDRGVSDNLGGRLYLDNVATAKADPELISQAAVGRVKKVVFILSNAFVQHESSWDKSTSSPHAIPILAAADARTMERYSEDTVLWLQEMLNEFKNQQKLKGEVEIYFIELDFKEFANPVLAEY
jgi:NTE family protein